MVWALLVISALIGIVAYKQNLRDRAEFVYTNFL